MADGFISPEIDTNAGVDAQLKALTAQVYELPPITRGTYILAEEDLPKEYKELLHGRAYVIDAEITTETDSAAPRTYYIAADQVQGLIVPARSMFIKCEGGNAKYRFSDDGERWTSWVSLQNGMGHAYIPQELCRFAEVQVYAETYGTLISLRATR